MSAQIKDLITSEQLQSVTTNICEKTVNNFVTKTEFNKEITIITETISEDISGIVIPENVSDLNNDTGFITSSDLPTKVSELTNDTGFITSVDLPTKVSDLNNDTGFITEAALPTKVSNLTNDTGFITTADVPTKTSELTNDSNFVVATDLATVATSGAYSDLSGTPSIPSKVSDLTNDTGFITTAAVPTATSDLTNDSEFITNAVNDLVNYYLKSETYTKTEVDSIATAIRNSRFEVVNSLPTEDIETNVIYLVPKSSVQSSNAKDEYINLDGTSNGWEKIGDTEIDLSGYATTAAMNTALADYTTTTDLNTLFAEYTKSEDLATVATSGDYSDLSNTPDIPSKVSDLTNDTGFITTTDVPTKVSDFTNDTGFITSEALPTKVSDLNNDTGFITSVALPTKVSDLTNDTGFITTADVPTKTSELTNDSNFVVATDLATVATSGAYSDLSGTPSIPAKVSDLTNDTGFITDAALPTATSDLTNDSGFITSADLPTKVSDLSNDTGFITSAAVPTKTSDLINDDEFITNAVNDLVNYYLKSETYTKSEVDAIATAVKNSRFEVVSELPTEDIQTNVIYLVPKSSAQSSNTKDEYINLNGTTAGWEKIGDTEIDLSGYATTAAMNTALEDYVTSTGLTTILADYVLSADLTTTLADYAQSADLATVATSGSYNDLTDKPTIPSAVSDLTNDTGFITSADIPTNVSDLTNDAGYITSASVAGLTDTTITTPSDGQILSYDATDDKWKNVNSPAIPTNISDFTNDAGYAVAADLATVATSGAYSDLSGTPSIPSKVSDLTNDTGFITTANVPTNVSDLTNDAGYAVAADLATVATSGTYSDLSGTPSIPSKVSDLTNDTGFITTAAVPTATSDLTNDSGFITNAVNDLVSYYLKSETYTKTEVDAIATNIKNSRFEVVNTLPTEDIETNVIYLVPKSSAQSSNAKDEYINLDGTSNGWEKIGDTEIDLSGYVTSTALSTALADYVTSTGLTTILADYVESTDLAAVATSGDYTDLSNTPTIPSKVSDLTNDTGFITTANVPTATSDLTNDSGFITSASVATLTDATITTPADGEVLKYDSTSGKWINGVGSTVAAINDLTDVTITSASNGQVIINNGSGWVNGAVPEDTTKYGTADTAETDIDDADYFPFYDTSDTSKKKSLWSNIKSVLKTYFDTLYADAPTIKTATLTAGSTTVTFTDMPTTGTNIIDFFTSNGVNYLSVTESGTSVTVEFEEQESDITVYCRIEQIS